VWPCAWSADLSAGTVRLRGLQPGDLGWVISRHGALYASEYGLDGSFEVAVAEIVLAIMQRFDPRSDGAWVAELDGAAVGSVFIVRSDEATAKLRLLIVDPAARGLGVGRLLSEAALDFARAAGYRRVTLWTMGMLDAARHLYAKAGFRMVNAEPAHQFGRDLVNETWMLKLPVAAS
jgi:GNAT superfamily N-acetyltransferase